MKQFILNLLPRNIYLTLKRWKYKRDNKDNFEKMQSWRTATFNNGYSYKPFDDNKAIFVHIPKCAGVSISRALFGSLAGGHTTFESYLNIFEPRCIENYFKFTIVRNPWDRLVSAYFFLRRGGFNPDDRDWFNKELGSYESFDDFVKRWLTKENIWKWHHFRPQYFYMLERREKVSLDFVGFLENIEKDYIHIKKKIGATSHLQMMNKSKHSAYQKYYSAETKEIVAEVYAKDIKMLGYNFDNTNLEKQLQVRYTKKKYSLRS